MAGDKTLSYVDPGAGGFIDLAQFGIKPERDKYYARVNPKTGCWECVEIPANCQIPTQGKTAHLKFDRVAHARPIMCVPDRVACGCGCGCAKCEPFMDVTTGEPTPCLRVTKSCDPAGPYKEGEEVVFAFVVENCGNTDIMQIQLMDDMGPVDGGPIDLAPGAIDETSFTAVVTVTAEHVAAGGFTNTATATGTVPDSAEVIDAPPASHEVVVEGEPCLKVTKSCDPAGPHSEGDTITYGFTVENCGNVPLPGVMVADSLVAVDGGPIDLEPGATDSTTFSATLEVTADHVAAGVILNTASATALDGNGQTVEAPESSHEALISAGCIEIVEPAIMEDETINACPADASAEPAGLEITPIDRGFEGFGPFQSDDSMIPQLTAGTLPIPIPAANPNCVLLLQTVWGMERGNNLGFNNLNELVLAQSGSEASNVTTLFDNPQMGSALGGQVHIMDTTGAAGDSFIASIPNVDTAAMGPHAGEGVINWQWFEICRDDGAPLTTADYDAAQEIQSMVPQITTAGQSFPDSAASPDCDMFALIWGRHVQHTDGIADTREIDDTDWAQWNGATELTDTTSWNGDGIPGAEQCQLGMGGAFVPAGSTFSADVLGNLDSVPDAWNPMANMFAGGFNCETEGSVCDYGAATPAIVTWRAQEDCDAIKTYSADLDAVIPDGEFVQVEIIIDGVVVDTVDIIAGLQTITGSSAPFTVAADDTGDCTVEVKAVTDGNDGTGVMLTFTNQTFTVV